MNYSQIQESCQGLRKCVGIINAGLHDDIESQRAKNIAEARAYDQIPYLVEARIRDIVAATFKYGKTSSGEIFRIKWPGQEGSYISSAPYWVKRNRNSHTFEVHRGETVIARFMRQTNRGELYANLAGAIESDLLS